MDVETEDSLENTKTLLKVRFQNHTHHRNKLGRQLHVWKCVLSGVAPLMFPFSFPLPPAFSIPFSSFLPSPFSLPPPFLPLPFPSSSLSLCRVQAPNCEWACPAPRLVRLSKARTRNEISPSLPYSLSCWPSLLDILLALWNKVQ